VGDASTSLLQVQITACYAALDVDSEIVEHVVGDCAVDVSADQIERGVHYPHKEHDAPIYL
jgi:hypothetical protein